MTDTYIIAHSIRASILLFAAFIQAVAALAEHYAHYRIKTLTTSESQPGSDTPGGSSFVSASQSNPRILPHVWLIVLIALNSPRQPTADQQQTSEQ